MCLLKFVFRSQPKNATMNAEIATLSNLHNSAADVAVLKLCPKVTVHWQRFPAIHKSLKLRAQPPYVSN